jgi:transcriptional regulator with XRE-family HTH domain
MSRGKRADSEWEWVIHSGSVPQLGDDVATAAEQYSLRTIRRACAESAIEINAIHSTCHRRSYGMNSSKPMTFVQRLKVSTSVGYSRLIGITAPSPTIRQSLNQELLGRWLGLTQAQVSKLENGKPEQNLEALRNYAKILHLPQHLLWFDLPGQSRLRSSLWVEREQAASVAAVRAAPADHGTDETSTVVERIEAIEARSIGSTTLDLPSNSAGEAIDRPASRLAFSDVMGSELADLDVALKPVGISEAMLDRFERTACSIHTHFATVAPAQLLPVVNDHIRAVARLLGVGQPIAYRRRLCSIAGHLAGQRAWFCDRAFLPYSYPTPRRCGRDSHASPKMASRSGAHARSPPAGGG